MDRKGGTATIGEAWGDDGGGEKKMNTTKRCERVVQISKTGTIPPSQSEGKKGGDAR